MQVICSACHRIVDFDPREFRCSCGGAWEPLENSEFNPDLIEANIASIWRYRQILDIPQIKEPLSLGAGWTPLLAAEGQAGETWFKLEYIAPTGSFKDRGTEVEVNYLNAMHVRQVVEDSSGNAGASLAAYAARAGIQAAIYAPESASPVKLVQIEVFGVELRKISGPRIEATRAVLKAVESGTVYASHAYNPVYLLGQQTFAWEIWEQMGRQIPDAIVIPVGQGGLLLGAWLGFRRLLLAGLISRLPRLFAVQPELLAPIVKSFSAGDEDVEEIIPSAKSLAEGLAIVKPVRGRRILQALRESNGAAAAVSEDEIVKAYHQLARKGFFVEPTSAAAAAALPQVQRMLGRESKIVVALTGSGLKSQLKE